MPRITQTTLPDVALLRRYENDYTDCFATIVDADVSLADFVFAFYTTWLFRLERRVLSWLVRKPSTDADAVAVARGNADRFAAWRVEDRREDQLLMCDFRDRTRSWFMVRPAAKSTTLLFGSAVTGTAARDYHWFLPVHRLYSRLLLSAARSKVRRRG